jgi:hypothetical protein
MMKRVVFMMSTDIIIIMLVSIKRIEMEEDRRRKIIIKSRVKIIRMNKKKSIFLKIVMWVRVE